MPLRYGNPIVTRRCVDSWSNYYTVQNLPFEEDITIKAFGFFAKRPKEIQFIIYRRDGDAFSIVCKSHMVQAKCGVNRVPIDPIEAKKGDLMGWYVPSNGVIAFSIDLGGWFCTRVQDRSCFFTSQRASSVSFKYSSNRTYSITVEGEEPVKPAAVIAISDIFYDGLEKTTEGDEYIEITNTGTTPGDISGYRINAGDKGQDFIFPENTILSPGAAYRVYTNMTDLSTGGFSFGSKKAIWNNAGDVGVLFAANGTKVDEFEYSPTEQP